MTIGLLDRLTLAETGALALAETARDLDAAGDTAAFLEALDRNQTVWRLVAQIAMSRVWQFPNERQVAFALSSGAPDDERVSTLIDINREVSALLAGVDDMEALRQRAMAAWTEAGKPGQSLLVWLLAEMEAASG